jgi:hypothetical protein
MYKNFLLLIVGILTFISPQFVNAQCHGKGVMKQSNSNTNMRQNGNIGQTNGNMNMRQNGNMNMRQQNGNIVGQNRNMGDMKSKDKLPASVNNPVTVLSYKDDIKLTVKQVQLIEKMIDSGKQHAAQILTDSQRKQLVKIVGPVRKPKSIF